MTFCVSVTKFGLILTAFTIHLASGFEWTNHNIHGSLKSNLAQKNIPPELSRKARLLLSVAKEDAKSNGKESTKKDETHAAKKEGKHETNSKHDVKDDQNDIPMPGEEEYIEDPELTKERDPMDPSPFTLFLIDRQFKKFEEMLHQEFAYVEEKLQDPPAWDIHFYRAYLLKAFSMLSNIYTVEATQDTGNGTCDHLILPNQGFDGFGFILNYVVSKTKKNLRPEAKSCLQKMLDLNFGNELRSRYPPLDDVYKVCIAFKGPDAAMEYSDKATRM